MAEGGEVSRKDILKSLTEGPKKKGGSYNRGRAKEIVKEHPGINPNMKKNGGNWEAEAARQELRGIIADEAAKRGVTLKTGAPVPKKG